jgi:hypothetical protein
MGSSSDQFQKTGKKAVFGVISGDPPVNISIKVDSFLTPMISSVQNLQTTIKNAPENMIGMVKGITDTVESSINKIRPNQANSDVFQSTGSSVSQVNADRVSIDRSVMDDVKLEAQKNNSIFDLNPFFPRAQTMWPCAYY